MDGAKQVLNGNNQVIELLERSLRYARQGHVRYAGILLCSDPNAITLETAGASDMEDQLPDVLDRFKASIDPRVKNRNSVPPRDVTLGADYVCYNCASMPLSFDFIPWLLVQEMRRRRENAPSPLKVGFWFGQDGQTGLETEYRKTMFTHVVNPLLNLIGAVESRKAIQGIYDQLDGYRPYRDIVELSRSGEIVPKLGSRKGTAWNQVAGWIKDKPITITLREADHWRDRNSNKPAWLSFAADLKRQGHRVIFIRDTARANEPLGEEETCPLASVNLEFRAALYEQSEANLFVSNGPAMIAFHSTRPCLMFTPIDDDGLFLAGTSRWWRDTCDMEAHKDQWPWTQKDQRIVWDLDTYTNISKSWEELNAVSVAA